MTYIQFARRAYWVKIQFTKGPSSNLTLVSKTMKTRMKHKHFLVKDFRYVSYGPLVLVIDLLSFR